MFLSGALEFSFFGAKKFIWSFDIFLSGAKKYIWSFDIFLSGALNVSYLEL